MKNEIRNLQITYKINIKLFKLLKIKKFKKIFVISLSIKN